jgi:hypothetical protein
MKYTLRAVGLGGIFVERTPYEYITGYEDPILKQLSLLPVYMGGDQTVSPTLSIASSPTTPPNNNIRFFTGVDDYSLTRSYAKWLDSETITIQYQDYQSINHVIKKTKDPWDETVYLRGTDGN